MRRENDILRILIFVFAGLIAVAAIALIIYYNVASKKLKGIEMTPDFIETQLEVGTQYTFSINATPKKASLKKIKCSVDDPTCSFEYEDGKAILTTGINEGTVTVFVECNDIKSQVLTFSVVDSAARAQAEAAAAESAANEEAQFEAASDTPEEDQQAEDEGKHYVKCIGDDVRVRAQNNTDCDILGKAKNGQAFEKVEEVDDWTHIIFDGRDAYMKTEFLVEISETQYYEALQAAGTSENAEEEKKEEEKKPDETNDQAATQSKAEAEAKAKADAEAQAAAELEAQAAAAAAAAAAAGTSLECADGAHNFTPAQYNFLKGFWQREGQTSPDDWKVYAHKHTYDECVQICQIEGGIY